MHGEWAWGWAAIEAIATAIAAGAAIIAGYYAGRAWAADRDRARRAQAELVSVWAEGKNVPINPNPIVKDPYQLIVLNNSNQTIWSVHVEAFLDDHDEPYCFDEVNMVAPHQRATIPVAGQEIHDRMSASITAGGRRWSPEWRFIDASGRTWHRDKNGTLHDLDAQSEKLLRRLWRWLRRTA